MEHSAEWLRGAYRIASRYAPMDVVMQINVLLAAAEAREAGEPSAAEVISKVRAELLKCLDNAKTLPQDARQAGVVAGWESAIDLLEALCDGSIMDTVKPTTAEVIRVAKVALEPFSSFSAYANKNPRRGLDNNLYSWDCNDEANIRLTDLHKAEKALAAIAAWEANNDR